MDRNPHKIITTDRQIDAALDRAQGFSDSDRCVVKARYDSQGDRITLFLADGVNVSIPRKYLQGLESATRAEVSDIEILGQGTGLHWPQLDVDHYVPGLLNSIFGTRRWMSELGRRGGTSSSEAKAEAARINGLKGGRPRKSPKRAAEANGKRTASKSRRKTA
jgi:hypothetical protein